MVQFLIGTGGWAYFQIPGVRPLDAYARAFDFVEVNSTFYEIPSLKLVRLWRRRVSPDFEFSVRCHRDVTHKYQLEPVGDVIRIVRTMLEICRTLNTPFLVLETPPTLHFSKDKVESIKTLFDLLDLQGFRIVWEVRRKGGALLPPGLVTLMRDLDIIHCVDLSRQSPVLHSNTVYTRVFGKGEHNVYQFTDEELRDIDRNISVNNPEKAIISFHNVRMYKDAARYKIFKETNNFPSVTGTKGRQSLRKVLEEDAKFPATKQQLIQDQGWKVIDVTEEKRCHASTLLEQLPDRNFRSVEEVVHNLPKNNSLLG